MPVILLFVLIACVDEILESWPNLSTITGFICITRSCNILDIICSSDEKENYTYKNVKMESGDFFTYLIPSRDMPILQIHSLNRIVTSQLQGYQMLQSQNRLSQHCVKS